MLAAESPITHRIHLPKPGNRRPLQPKNIPSDPPIKYAKPGKDHHALPISSPNPIHHHSNKENNPVFPVPIEDMDASLAEELSAVKRKLNRLKMDKEKTEKTLQERDRALDFAMIELEQRGEFQKELEIEVDRLYRLNQLKLASMDVKQRRSPIRSLREREMEKKNKEAQSEEKSQGARAGESMEGLVDQSSSTESTPLSFKSTSASTSASTSTSSSLTKSPIPLRWSLENVSDK